MGYREMRITFAEQPPRKGLMERPIVLGGRTVGSWRRVLSVHSVTVEARFFKKLDRRGSQALQEAVDRFGLFLQLPATLQMKHA